MTHWMAAHCSAAKRSSHCRFERRAGILPALPSEASEAEQVLVQLPEAAWVAAEDT